MHLVQLSLEDNIRHLDRFHELLKKMNPDATLMVTLSPVPSRATFFDRNVVVQSGLNNAILRVALLELCKRHDDVIYFPAYEIVQSWRGNPFEPDNRHVRPVVVNEIMSTFFRSFS